MAMAEDGTEISFLRKASGPYFAKSWDESSRYLVAADGLPLGDLGGLAVGKSGEPGSRTP